MLVDGSPVASDWTTDRGLHYGDGLFETLVVRSGSIRFVAEHLKRLTEGCRRLDIDLDCAAAMAEAQREARRPDSDVLKLIVTRGLAIARGYTPLGTERARRILLRYAATAAQPAPSDCKVLSIRSLLGENPQLAGIKHLNRLEQILARRELRGSDAYEGLMSSSSGLVISGTMSNMFVVRNDRLLTPRLDRCGIAGVMRSIVLREARHLGIDAAQTQLTPADLRGCDELFLTNARIGVLPVATLDGRSLRTGAVTRALQARVDELHE